MNLDESLPNRPTREPLIGGHGTAATETRKTEPEHLRLVFESIKDYAILTLDLAGVVTGWNPGAQRLFGYTALEIIGQDGAVLWTPEDRAHGADAQEREGAGRDGMAEDKRWHQRQDGSRFFANGTMRPLLDEAGNLRGFTKVCRDATMESAVQERLAAIVESSDDAIISKNLHSVIMSWNAGAQRIFGYTAEEMIGQSIYRLIPAERRGEEDDILSKISRGEPVSHMETVRVARDGRQISLSVTISPIRDLTGKVVGASKVARDISEHKLAEARQLETERAARAQAEHASRMKDEFLATLSHELRTPLNAILGWTQVLRGDPANTADMEAGPGHHRAQRPRADANHRGPARHEQDHLGQGAPGRAGTRPGSSGAGGGRDHAPGRDAKNIRLQAIIDPEASIISGDPNRLQQVFWNLFTNAIKFTPKEGQVQVVLARVHSHLEVSVTDSGEGIAPEFLPYVFDRFRQQDASTTRRHGGLGMGLAIVKQLVELHGGSIHVDSAGLGQGTTFRVMLPLSALRPEADLPGEERSPRNADAGGGIPRAGLLDLTDISVLVVDDEVDARALIKRLLEDRGAIVRMAGSVAEAFALLEAERPDVLVSDIGMPGEDGYALIRRVRALPAQAGGDVPAIALTAYARSEDRLKAIMAGFQMHLAKPVEAAELLAQIASLAGRMSNR